MELLSSEADSFISGHSDGLLKRAEQRSGVRLREESIRQEFSERIATSVIVMGSEKGIALIDTLPNTEAVLITAQPNFKIIKTTGADKYIK